MSDYATDRVVTFKRSVSIGYLDKAIGRFYQDRGRVVSDSVVVVGDGSKRDNWLVLEGDANFSANHILLGDDGNSDIAGKGSMLVAGNAKVTTNRLSVAYMSASATGFVGDYTQTGGTLRTIAIGVGGGMGSQGTLQLHDGLMDVSQWMTIGRISHGGSGAVEQSGGVLAVAEDVTMGFGGNRGTFHIRGGETHIGRDLILRYSGAGHDAFVEQSGGSVKIGRDLLIGNLAQAGDDAFYSISGGALEVRGDLYLSNSDRNRCEETRFQVIGSEGSIRVGGLLLGSSNGYASTLGFALDANGISPIEVEGVVDLAIRDGEKRLDLSLLATPQTSVMVLIDNDGTDPIRGEFTGLPDGAIIPMTHGSVTQLWELTYDFDSASGVDGLGNDLAILLRVPEPSTTVLLALSGLLVAGRRIGKQSRPAR